MRNRGPTARGQDILEGARDAALDKPQITEKAYYKCNYCDSVTGNLTEFKHHFFVKDAYVHEQFFKAGVSVVVRKAILCEEYLAYIYVHYADDSYMRKYLTKETSWYAACQMLHKKDVLNLDELVNEGFEFE